MSSLIVCPAPRNRSSRCTTAALLHHGEHGRTHDSLVNKLPTCWKIARNPIIFFVLFFLNVRTRQPGEEERRALPVTVCGSYQRSPSVWSCSRLLSLSPSSSITRFIHRTAHPMGRCCAQGSHTLRTNGKGAWPRASCAGEGHAGARR